MRTTIIYFWLIGPFTSQAQPHDLCLPGPDPAFSIITEAKSSQLSLKTQM